jgi:acyl carrier protein
MLEEIQKVWKDKLGADNVDADAAFFEIGGNSLVGMMIVDELEKKYGVKMSPTDLYEYDTVRKLTGYIQNLQAKKS